MLYRLEFKKKRVKSDTYWFTAMNTPAEKGMFTDKLPRGAIKNVKKRCLLMKIARDRAEAWSDNEYRVVPMEGM